MKSYIFGYPFDDYGYELASRKMNLTTGGFVDSI